jgi:2-(1,2-epoxy-1,2-dihydrophenyl)acetyl-CoA isomerase
LEWGLINSVVPDNQVLPTALEIARQWAKGPTRSLAETKRLILSGATESLESQMERESRAIAAMSGSADGREGIAAFVAKRPPQFGTQGGARRDAELNPETSGSSDGDEIE